MSTRQFLFVDSIIGSVQKLIEDFSSDLDLNDPSDAEALETFVVHIYDVLDKIGMPVEAIRLALGEHMNVIDDQQGNPVHCWLCDDPAVGLVQYRDDWRLACNRHAPLIAEEGRKPVPVRQ